MALTKWLCSEEIAVDQTSVQTVPMTFDQRKSDDSKRSVSW